MTRYDYIIIGAGASGLMLADALGRDAFFAEKSILLLDRDAKKTDDRTWSFWEKGQGLFDDIVYKHWNHLYFGGQDYSGRFDISPYTYKTVRGIDFYESYLNRIASYPNITFRQEKVVTCEDNGSETSVTTDQEKYTAARVFNSIFDYKMATNQDKYPVLQQHFLGWTVRTDDPVFEPDRVSYMDFSVPQKGNTRFMYVLPFSSTEALVEYTLFSKELLPKQEYKEALIDYLTNKLGCKAYEITDAEQGSIPMTCYDFQEHHTENIRYIGTAGGWAKPSTGYTFIGSSKKVPVLVDYLKTGKPLDKLDFKNRFWYYDLLLLDVLARDNAIGHHIFETLFKNRDPRLVLKFLDEETSLFEDLKFILGCPTMPFLKALLRRVF